MLYLTRKLGQSIMIGDDIEITLIEVKGKSAKLGVTFPPQATVLRREIYDRIQEENREAAQSGSALADDLMDGAASTNPAPTK